MVNSGKNMKQWTNSYARGNTFKWSKILPSCDNINWFNFFGMLSLSSKTEFILDY